MKLTAIFLLAAALQVSAKGYSQNVTLSLKDAPLEKVFSAIEKQTGYYFTYTRELLQGTKPVDLEVKNASLQDVLAICLKGQPITYQIIDKAIIIKQEEKKNLIAELPPPIDVHGRVVDEKGQPVTGVTVKVKGSHNATSTNDNGEFTLTGIENNATLVFTSTNMETFEVKVNGKTDLAISLKTKITALGGISVVTVNTGYQQISKERIVGSFSQLDSASYNRRAGMNIISRLDGTVTGVLFDKKSIIPIQIRGISTLGGPVGGSYSMFEPLIVVDNFPMDSKFDINSINPNDVESITVLKDASTASIWGTRAGNGVIVVKTKKSRYNQPLHVAISSNITIQEKPDQFYKPQMRSSDFIDVEQFLFNKGYFDANLSDLTNYPVISPVVEILNKQRAGTISSADATAQINALRGMDLRNDLDKYVYKNSGSQQHYINFSGGSNVMNYQLSAGYNNNMPNIQGSKGSEQYTISSNESFRLFKNLELQTGINYSQTTDKTYNFSLPPLYPYAQLEDANGNHLPVSNTYRMAYVDTVGSGKLLDWHYKPLDEIGLADNTSINRFTRLNFGVTYRFNSWLNFEFKYQYLTQTSTTRNYYNQQTYFARNVINKYTNLSQTNPSLRNPVPIGGILDFQNGQANSHNLREQLNFNKTWGWKHLLTGLVATEVSESNSGNNTNRLYGYNDVIGTYNTSIDYLNRYPYFVPSGNSNTIPQNTNISQGALNRFVSVIANASYTYKKLYTIYASGRRDGANIFGVNTNNKWKPLWSVGSSWDISKESFYSIKWMSSLRLHASYGYMGNVDNILSGKPTILYVPSPATSTNLPYAQIGAAPNPDLRWEQVRTINLGMDFSLFKNRLSGSLDVFSKKSTDLISNFPYDPTSGVTAYTVNAANLRGTGYELQLNSRNTTGFIKWETSFGLSHAKTIVTKIYNGGYKASDFINYTLNPAVGKLAYGISSYRWAGLDPTTGDPQGYLNGQVSKNYSAIFNDSIQNQVFNGSSIPLYSGYIGNSITWKNLSLSANITYRLDFYFRKPSINYGSLFAGGLGDPEYSLRWQKPGDEKVTNVPSMIYPVPSTVSQRDLFYANSEINVLRGDNIRLQDVRLQYNLDNNILKRLPIKSAQFFIYANNLNLILWRKDKSSVDPDFTYGITVNTPTPKTWTAGVNINF